MTRVVRVHPGTAESFGVLHTLKVSCSPVLVSSPLWIVSGGERRLVECNPTGRKSRDLGIGDRPAASRGIGRVVDVERRVLRDIVDTQQPRYAHQAARVSDVDRIEASALESRLDGPGGPVVGCTLNVIRARGTRPRMNNSSSAF